MVNRLSNEELQDLKSILEDLPAERREKILQAFQSGRLLSFVLFIDNIVAIFESIGRLGAWINKVLRPILTGLLFLFAVYLWYTGGQVDLTKLIK